MDCIVSALPIRPSGGVGQRSGSAFPHTLRVKAFGGGHMCDVRARAALLSLPDSLPRLPRPPATPGPDRDPPQLTRLAVSENFLR